MRARARFAPLALAAAAAAATPAFAAAAEPAPITAPAAAHALPRIVVAFANSPSSAPGPAGATGHRYSADGYRVSQSAAREARRIASAYALHEVASWPIRELAMHCVIYEIAGGRPPDELLSALAHEPRVMLAEPLQEFHTLSGPEAPPPYNDPLYDLQTNLSSLGVPEAHRRARGAGVRIALIDTAVDTHHPDLEGRVAQSRSFTGTNRGADGSQRHGTAMAGIIAAVANNHIGIVGIAPLARLEVFAACWQLEPGRDAAVCNTFTLAQALAAALESGAPLVNLSIAGPADPLLTALIESGVKRGVVFVGAREAGNAFPADVPGVIGAAGSEDAIPPGTFAAPARHVLTLRPGGEYDFESGSSVAAAEISAVIALLMSATPARLSADTLTTLLKSGPQTVASTAAPGVNAAAALARLDVAKQRACAARSTETTGAPDCTALAGLALDAL